MRPWTSHRDPRLWVGGLAIALVVAVFLGWFWPTVIVIGLAMVVVFARVSPGLSSAVAFTGLLFGHVLMVMEPLSPEDNNYVVYAIVIAAVVGVAQLSWDDWRPVAPMAFLAVLTAGAAYSTVVLRPTIVYALLAVPLGLAAGYLAGRHSPGRAGDYVLGAVLVLAVGESLIGISQTVLGTSPFVALGSPVYSEPRNYLALVIPWLPAQVRLATGTFEHFNQLGAVLALSLPLALWSWLNRKSVANALAMLTVAVGLICTFSRGALLAAVLSCLVLALTRAPKDERKAIRVSLVALATTVGGALGFASVQEYAQATGNVASRLGAWQVALAATLSDPGRLLIGAGYGFYGAGFLVEHGALSRLHSMPLQIFAELGLLGLIAAIAAFGPPIARGLAAGGGIETAMAASCLAFLLHQLFDNAFFGFGGVLFMAVFGLLVASARATTGRAAHGAIDVADAN